MNKYQTRPPELQKNAQMQMLSSPRFMKLKLSQKLECFVAASRYSGCITSSLRLFLKQDCGLTDHSINTFIRQLQTHTCKYNSKLIGTRAALKKKLTKLLPLPLPLAPPAPTLGLASPSTAAPTAPPPPGSVSLPPLPSAPASLPPSTGVG